MSTESHGRAAAAEGFAGDPFSRILEFFDDAAFLLPLAPDESGVRFTAVNLAACELLGYSRAELMQKSPMDMEAGITVEALDARAAQLLTDDNLLLETTLLTKDGGHIPVEIKYRLFEWNGRSMNLFVARDLSNGQPDEAVLRESEENFRGMFANAPVGIYQSTDNGLLAVNPALAKMFGFESPAEVLASSVDPTAFFAQPDDRVKILSEARESETYGQREVVYRRKDGSTFTANLRMRAVRGEAGGIKFFEGFVEDITERKDAEKEVKRLSQWLLRTQSISKVGGWAINLNTGAVWVSPEARRIYGASDVEQLTVQHVQSYPLPQYRRPLDLALRDLVMHQTPYDVEFQIRRRLDQAIVDIHSIAEYDAKEEIVLGVVEDITERKRLEERLRQSQKMEAVGQLAGGVAHDFNNILAATLMQLGLLQQSPHLAASAKESLKEVEKETLRAANLTRQLLLFSRRQVAQVQPLNITELVEDLLKMLQRLLGEQIEVSFQNASEVVWVSADAGMMEQVVMNLCINARDAMPRGGRLTLEIVLVDIDTQRPISHPEARPGRFVCLSVSDTGCGMDGTVLRRIFEPFYTTKDVGKGTGLGLATVYGIVQQHKGWVEVESEVGKGSVFRVYLPAGLSPSDGAAEALPVEIKGGTETILLVEDEQTLGRLTAQNLRKLGYTVLEAGNGVEAQSVWEQHQQKIDLLFTDMVMPEGKTGLDLAQSFRTEKVTLKVIISSGYSADLAESRPFAGQEIMYLAKPYTTAALAKLVRTCLDNPITS
jgi:PAS domain S-box-containing protein